MQKDIGSVMGLYPTPQTVVGAKKDGKVNFLAVAPRTIVAGVPAREVKKI